MTRLWATASALLFLCAALAPSASPDELRLVLRPASRFVVESEGKPTGFEVDLADMFAAWMRNKRGEDVSYRVSLVATVPELLRTVEEEECDLAIGAITITDERDRTVDFSEPYLPTRTVLIARPGVLAEASPDEALAGNRVGAIVGSTHAERVVELKERVSGLKAVTSFPTNDKLFDALLSGAIEAAATDVTHYWVLSQRSDVVMVRTLGVQQGLGMVFPQGSSLKPVADEFLREFRHTSTYFNLIQRYFGTEAAKMVKLGR
jgi:polar amino acid transport system substrate-binding protein